MLYLACVWVFAAEGRGTPGLWDWPRRVVAVGPYRWVRNPIYLAADPPAFPVDGHLHARYSTD